MTATERVTMTATERVTMTAADVIRAQAGNREPYLEDEADARRLDDHAEQTEPGWA